MAQFVHHLHDAHQRTAIHDWRYEQRPHGRFRSGSVALRQPWIPSIGNANTFTVVGNCASHSFVGFQHLPFERCWIVSLLMHQLDGFVGVQQPDVDGFSFQNLPELRSDEWQQLRHLQRRRKYFFEIVELCKTGDGLQCAVTLLFITLRSGNGDGTQGRCGLQSNDHVIRQFFIE